MAAVLLEDIYKRISIAPVLSDERQVVVSKLICEWNSSEVPRTPIPSYL